MDTLIGNGITTTQEFKDEDGDLTDPTTVTLTVRQPDGTKTVFTYLVGVDIVRDSAGVYTYSVVPSTAGPWGFYWKGTGTVPRATEEFIVVNASRVLL